MSRGVRRRHSFQNARKKKKKRLQRARRQLCGQPINAGLAPGQRALTKPDDLDITPLPSAKRETISLSRNSTIIHGNSANINGSHNLTYIRNVRLDDNQVAMRDSLLLLWTEVEGVGAMHNSETRHPFPKCFPGTRQEVLKPLLSEIEAAGSNLYWISAPLGVGKTTVAQTICEECTEKGISVASFFFSKHPRRNVPSCLFLSIAYQLFSSVPELRGPISTTIHSKPGILEGTLDWQFEELIVKPCRALWATKGDRVSLPRVVVVIDALECIGRVDAQRVLTIIGNALSESPWLPLQFLICSRPEPYIKDIFDTGLISLRVSRYALRVDLSKRDVATYLRQECKRIRRDDRFKNIPFPTPWPTKSDIKKIAKKSCGQFSYASSLVQYLEDGHCLPYLKLDIALGRIPPPRPGNTFPFASLDVLYRDVLSAHHDRSHLLDILAVVILKTFKYYSVAEVEFTMNLEPGEIRLALSGMHSVLSVPKHSDLKIADIKVYHDSFSDFLFDKLRSGDFHIDQSTFVLKFDGLIAGSIR